MYDRLIQRAAPQLLLLCCAIGCPALDPVRATAPEAGAAAGDALAAAGAPRIACDAPVADFGTVPAGATVERTFTIRNTGRGVLRIDRAQGG